MNALTPAIRWLRTSPTGHVALLAGLVAAWLLLYRINESLWEAVLFGWLGLAPEERLSETLRFFFYDSTKIALLLSGIIFLVTVLRSYLSVERTRALLAGRREGIGNVLAGLLGVVTPFCSCSAVPAFIGFLAAGIPLGVTMSFLIASPMVNEVAIGLLFSLFGWRITLIYIGSGLAIAILAGWVLGRLRLERWVESFVYETKLHGQAVDGAQALAFQERLQMGAEEVASILRQIWPYLLIGIGVGALIHGWVPTNFFATHAGRSNPFGVLLAVGIGIPLYSNAAGVMPMVQALYEKGLPMGTVLAFMMSVVALSVPELILLRRVLQPPLLAAFFSVTGVGIVLIGYLFNALLA